MLRIGKFLVPTSVVSGYLPETPAEEDFSFSFNHLDVATPTGEIDNRRYYLPISAQLHLPSCTANAVVDFWEAHLVRKEVQNNKSLQEALRTTPELSRLFCWYFARLWMEVPQHNNPNSGCYNRHCMEVLARFGLPTEALWPYQPHLACVRPSITSQRDAFKRRSGSFYSINESGNDRLVSIKRALIVTPGVVFGTGLGREFLQYKSGVLSTPKHIIGYHAMVIVGIDAQGNYLVRNSHGKDWGEEGYCRMSPEYITWEKSSGFWTAKGD